MLVTNAIKHTIHFAKTVRKFDVTLLALNVDRLTVLNAARLLLAMVSSTDPDFT